MSINTTLNPDTPTAINPTTVNTSNEDLVYACPRCVRTFTPHIGQVDHLRIHSRETGEPVPGTPTYTRPSASTVHTAFAHSCTARAYSATCVSTRAELTATPTHLAHPVQVLCLAAPTSSHAARPPPPASPSPSPKLALTQPTSHVHAVSVHAPHSLAWSVICKSIAQRLANQRLGNQPTLTAFAFTFHILLTHLFTAWVC
ncbi:hypothetical protein SprV_0401554100 [Sparganum proliferum]